MDCHCLTLEPRMTCLAYLPVFVVHITNPHECIVTLQIKCTSRLRLRIHLSIPLAYLQSIIPMPRRKTRYCWNTRITWTLYDRMISLSILTWNREFITRIIFFWLSNQRWETLYLRPNHHCYNHFGILYSFLKQGVIIK